MMDPIQLQLMQEASQVGMPGMMPGLYAPATTGGIGMLTQLSNQYAPPIAGNTLPDVSPLAPLNLQQYGLFGMLAGVAGNTVLSNMMTQQGLLPIGNAGSYLQAYRTREHLNMRQQVSQSVASQDAEGIYRTIRGAAALAGQPFNREQQQAARNVADTAAQYMPALAMFAPEMADAISGERGSVQAMATQMLEANRYRIDPLTGQMGYGKEANTDMVNQVFSTMFADDNMARMRGLRAGDIGQLYRQLAPEGLAGPTGGLRERTIQTLQRAREEGLDVTAMAKEQGVDLAPGQNLESLSNAELSKLRQSEGVKTRLSQSDARQITDQLQGYVASVSAMREVFGENGNPNAPVPQLINALKALTSGQMQKFDANQLNTMVRDMQAMSQLSGKSIDQLVAMNQFANASNTQILGQYGVHFNPAATNIGVTSGMAFSERGGATGFGALNREQAEQASMSMFSRGMGSQMSNALGALKQIEDAGGFANNEAGREMTAVMAAARSGASNYTFVDDAGNSVTRRVPTREGEFRDIVRRGAIEGMDTGNFNQMLGDRTSNLRALSTDSELQMAPFRQQAAELNRLSGQVVGNRLKGNVEIQNQIADPVERNRVSRAMGQAAVDALDNLSADQYQDTKLRNNTVADAIMAEAASNGVTLTREQALNIATNAASSRETLLRSRTGMDATAYAQTMGKQVREGREDKQAMVTARAGLNEAMSGLGPKGSITQRLFTALQKQGDRGVDANLNTLLGDMFAADMGQAVEKLSPVMQDVQARKNEIEQLTSQLEGAAPEDRAKISEQIRTKTKELNAKVTETRDLANSLGIVDKENEFNRADVAAGRVAARELEQLDRMSQVRSMAVTGSVSDAERVAAGKTKITDADLKTMAVMDRQKALTDAEKMADREAISEEELRARVDKQVREDPNNKQGYFTGPSNEALAQKVEDEFKRQRENIMSPEAKAVYDEAIRNNATPELARKRVQDFLKGKVGTVDQIAARRREVLGADATLNDIADPAARDAIIRSRRANRDFIPSNEQIGTRMDEMRKRNEGQAKKTQEEIDKLTVEEKNNYLKNEQELKTRAEDQLLAEGQLKSLGQLGEKESLMDDPAKLASLPPELRDKLVKAKPEDRAKLVFEHIDKQQQEQFYGKDAEEVTKKRELARAQMAQAEGKETAKETEKNLAVLSDKRREYLSDAKAISQGGARGMLAVKQSQKAEEELQTLANRYYGGSVGNMLASGGLAMDEKGLTKAREELANMTDEQREEVAARLKAEGRDIGGGKNVNEAQYLNYLALKARDAKKSMVEAHEGMAGAAEQTYASLLRPTDETRAKADKMFEGKSTEAQAAGLQALESAAMLKNVKLDQAGLDTKDIASRLAAGEKIDTSKMTPEQKALVDMAQGMRGLTGLSKEQIGALESMAKADTLDVKQNAEKLGVSEADYKAMMRGEKDVDPNLRMFDNAADLKAARADEQLLADKKTRLARVEKTLLSNPESDAAKKERDRLKGEIEQAEGRKADRMEKLGLDINDADDVKKYNTRLQNQGQVDLLEKRREDYLAKRKELSDKGMSKEEIDTQLGTMTELEKSSQAMAKEAKEKDLGSEAMNKLADAFGIQSVDERKAFKSKADLGTDSNKRNVQMLTNVLDQVDKLEMQGQDGQKLTKVEKLDQLIDQYAEAKTPQQKKELAAKYKMSGDQLDRMMQQTEFLDAAGADKKLDEKRLTEGLKSVSGRNIEEEVKKEQERTIRITGGTIEVKGDIVGTANVGELAGVYGSR